MTTSEQKDIWASGASYEPYVGRWSRLVAREFLLWLAVPPHTCWLDSGCGTGALSQTILEVMIPRLKGGGLHLGASRCNRVHDGTPRDIHGGIDVSVHHLSAVDTTEGGLTLAVLFCAMPTPATRPRRIARVNRVQWHASKSSLIRKEQTQLPKGPGGMARTLGFPNRACGSFPKVS